MSKAVILQKSIDCIQEMKEDTESKREELSRLKKELVAMEIMRGNYGQMVKEHKMRQTLQAAGAQANPNQMEAGAAGGAVGGAAAMEEDGRTDFDASDIKFTVFMMLMDKLFQSFNDQVSMDNFSNMSKGLLSWVEEQGQQQNLQQVIGQNYLINV